MDDTGLVFHMSANSLTHIHYVNASFLAVWIKIWTTMFNFIHYS